jgi:hypothetical protein
MIHDRVVARYVERELSDDSRRQAPP